MRKRISALFICLWMVIICCIPAEAAVVPREKTPNYKVAFYAFDCYHMQDQNGKRYGYGYEMMQGISKYMQGTFSYIGYNKSAKECEEMLRNGQLDLYTAAKKTPEREKEFVFSSHPAITATTCMNIKSGNHKVIAGDYTTYDGLKIGLLERHTYNDKFLAFAQEKGFDCEIVYYKTPSELSNALIDEEVDALVDSYIRTPEDEVTIENFGETPYYFMARKEDKELIREIDQAVDQMNLNTPKWRSDLYNKYYGTQSINTELTKEEASFLKKLQKEHITIRAVMHPDNNPYSWYQDGNGHGIVMDIFKETAKRLELDYEIIPVVSKEEYERRILDGSADIWLDIEGYSGDTDKYRMTDPFLSTTVSILRKRGTSGTINKIGIIDNNIDIKETILSTWPNAQIHLLKSQQEGVKQLESGEIDGILMLSYAAQKVAKEDTQNRFRAEIVPNSNIDICMGVNADADYRFYGIWEKTLYEVAASKSAELVQEYWEKESSLTLAAFLFDHPLYFVCMLGFLLVTIFVICLCVQVTRTKNKQLRISEQLSYALKEVKVANMQLEEQYQLLESMSRETADVFVLNLRNQTSTSIKTAGEMLPEDKRVSRPYAQAWDIYIQKHVDENDREKLSEAIQIEHVKEELSRAREYAYRYCLVDGETAKYCQVQFGYLGETASDYIVFGIRCIDKIILAEKEQQDILEEARDTAELRLEKIEILNKQLEEALQQAESANKAKSTFLFNMSHDIRTPMNAIVGYTDLILNHHIEGEKCEDYIHKIRSSSDFLLSLINNVLEMARIESNKVVLDEAPIPMGQIEDEVVAVYTELMKQKNIEFIQKSDIKTKYIYADKVKVKEIFLNLISNAYKYTPEGGTVTLSRRELPCEKEGYICIETIVSDTGIGMSKEFLPNLFEEFSRDRTVQGTKIQGSGLGMPIVKRLVELMGGTITVESELGKGTTFIVKTIYKKAQIEDIQKEGPLTVDTKLFQGKRILLAEDNELNAEIAMEVLKDFGFEVEWAEDGIICIDMLQKAESDYYDLILMDIQMPNMDGYKTTRTIRAMGDPVKRDIPIIAMTANAFEEDKKKALESGMNGHLGKPIDLGKLVEMLTKTFDEA